MWHAGADLWLNAKASGLGQDAVIEIMIALLGVMIAVLTLIAALFAGIIAILGVYGFQTIRDEATKIAGTIADKTATRVAHEAAVKKMDEIWQTAQATQLSEGQAEEKQSGQAATHGGKTKASTDKDLKNLGER